MSFYFWKDKEILVTGAGGFIGTALCSQLQYLGARIVEVSRKSSRPGMISINVTNKYQLNKLFLSRRFFGCIHLAGESLVEKGKNSPYNTFKSNIFGTLNILELCKIHHVKRVIISSTVHVYGDAKTPTTEDVSPRPSRPYETSKTCADLISQSYADSYHLPVLIPRFVNIYGPGDTNFSRLIPKTIRSVLHNQNPTLWGGDTKRDYLYISDAVSAFIALVQIDDKAIEKNRIFNFGTGKIISVQDLMTEILRLSNSKNTIVKSNSGREQEIALQYVKWEKARDILGWKPKTTLAFGLKQTLTWYRSYLGVGPS